MNIRIYEHVQLFQINLLSPVGNKSNFPALIYQTHLHFSWCYKYEGTPNTLTQTQIRSMEGGAICYHNVSSITHVVNC